MKKAIDCHRSCARRSGGVRAEHAGRCPHRLRRRQQRPQNADPVIMTAGTVTIHKSEFEAALKTLPAEYQSMLAAAQGRKQFADDFLRMRLLASEGAKAGLQNDPEVINQLNLMRENLVATAELKKIDSGITVSDAEIQKAYADNAKQYEQVKARHILIAPKGSPAAQAGKGSDRRAGQGEGGRSSQADRRRRELRRAGEERVRRHRFRRPRRRPRLIRPRPDGA